MLPSAEKFMFLNDLWSHKKQLDALYPDKSSLVPAPLYYFYITLWEYENNWLFSSFS